jgi:hypothetical protein
MHRSRLLLLGALLALAGAWLAWRSSAGPETRAPAPAPVREGVSGGPSVPGPAPRDPSPPAAPAAGPAPRPATGAPPVELPHPPPPAAGAPPRPRVTELHGAGEGPIDRRDHPGPRAKQQLEILKYAFETLEDDVQACLSQWAAQEPLPVREVMIAFELDPQGLQHSWVENAADLPFGPRSCLANAVYGLDWAGLADEPAKVTARFSVGDAGP